MLLTWNFTVASDRTSASAIASVGAAVGQQAEHVELAPGEQAREHDAIVAALRRGAVRRASRSAGGRRRLAARERDRRVGQLARTGVRSIRGTGASARARAAACGAGSRSRRPARAGGELPQHIAVEHVERLHRVPDRRESPRSRGTDDERRRGIRSPAPSAPRCAGRPADGLGRRARSSPAGGAGARSRLRRGRAPPGPRAAARSPPRHRRDHR